MSAHILVAAVTSWVRTGAVSGPLPLALMQALVAADQPACPSLGLQTTGTPCASHLCLLYSSICLAQQASEP